MGAARRERLVDDTSRPVTFDSGALIAIERADPGARALVRTLIDRRVPILVPAVVIAEVWRGGTGRQARLAHFLNASLISGHAEIVGLTYGAAKAVSLLLARAPMSVTEAGVCRCALLASGLVVTSDPTDIRRVIPLERIQVV